MVISGWRAAVVLVAGLVLLALLLVAVFWIGVLLAALAVATWFSLLLLPRIARRLRLPELALVTALLPLLALAGFALAGITGVATGSAIWAVAVALPRVLIKRLRARLPRRPSGDLMPTQANVIDARFRTAGRSDDAWR